MKKIQQEHINTFASLIEEITGKGPDKYPLLVDIKGISTYFVMINNELYYWEL